MADDTKPESACDLCSSDFTYYVLKMKRGKVATIMKYCEKCMNDRETK